MRRYVSICKTPVIEIDNLNKISILVAQCRVPPVYLAGAEQSAQGVKAKVGDTKEFS